MILQDLSDAESGGLGSEGDAAQLASEPDDVDLGNGVEVTQDGGDVAQLASRDQGDSAPLKIEGFDTSDLACLSDTDDEAHRHDMRQVAGGSVRDAPFARRSSRGGANMRKAAELGSDMKNTRGKRSLVQKAERLEKRLRKHNGQAMEERKAIASVFNKARLRRGERMLVGGAAQPAKRHQRHWVHPNSWTLEGTLTLAFSCIGRISQDALGDRQTRREVDAIAAVALAHRFRQEGNLQTFALKVSARAENVPWICVERAFDCTPANVRFGYLASVLAPQATYWWRDPKASSAGGEGAGVWRRLSFEEFSRRSRQVQIRKGTLEMFGQTARVSWAQGVAGQHASDAQGVAGQHAGDVFYAVRQEDLKIAPVFMTRSDASSLLSALEMTLPSLGLKAMAQLCLQVPLVVLVLVADLCAANTRARYASEKFAGVHNEARSTAGFNDGFFTHPRGEVHRAYRPPHRGAGVQDKAIL